MTEFFLIFGMFVVTFGVRYTVLAFVSRITLPEIVQRSLKYVPAAVLSAIIAPSVMITDGVHINWHPSNAYFIASLAAVAIAWRTKNLLLTILLGMGAFLGWRLLFPV